MPAPSTALPESPSAEEFAAALREGLAARRYFRPLPAVDLPAPSLHDAFPRLDYYRRIVDHPVPFARVPIVGPILRAVRRFAKKLVDPWLLHQTEFNEASVTFARLAYQHLAVMTERLNAVQRDIVPAYQATNARIGECAVDVHRLWQAIQPDGEPTLGLGDAPPEDPPHVIEGLFLHTRIGSPPGRVLVAGPGALHALDLAGLGFQVVLHTSAYNPPLHPELRVVPAMGVRGLPFPDASFDRVVVSARAGDSWAEPASDVWSEFARVLVPGGRLIASRAGVEPGEPTVGPLRIVETAYAHRAGHGWTMTTSAQRESEVVLWTAEQR